ncbi:hypothetical protein BO70DRAFT_426556 [Aspergillus heteromorphus CBS 117.55]|uniref:Uncharacterized protein n=1 Tax=Aspergillus heteromorphus CBS 117.55 TaxID=1448321 RepID=A0A317WUZ4_9EURO|nr:uncharacterized protein BO70DRAFT_426556 [Aspergillus heteromorphus CBS 117.55]PWY90179.1 hypothetical protein BO70DRAFT_426556 [Aspergillus heteromorphus CBS 117.55]
MSGMQSGISPSPLRTKSDPDLEDRTTITPSSSSRSSRNDWSSDIEKYQPYIGLLTDEHTTNHDPDDYCTTFHIDDRESPAPHPCRCQNAKRAFIYMASYVAFATLSFLSAAYYFWCLMPWGILTSNPGNAGFLRDPYGG